MKPTDNLRLAFNTLNGARKRAALSALGVTIGTMAVVLLVSLGQGVRNYVEDQFAQMGSNLQFVTPGRTMTEGGPPMPIGTDPLTLEDARAIRRQAPHVTGVMANVVGSTRAEWWRHDRDVMLIGTTSECAPMRNLETSAGTFLPDQAWESGGRVAVLGSKVAEELFKGRSPLGARIKVGESSFRVIGVMRSEGRQLGFDMDNVIYVPTVEAQRVLNQEFLTEIIFQSSSESTMELAAEEVRRILVERHDGEEDFTVMDPGSILAALDTVIGMVTAVIGAIAAISLLVGGVGIMNIMLVSVTERTGEIGVRRAVGARGVDILLQFLTESSVLSGFGGVVGLAVGVSLVAAMDAGLPDFRPEAPLWAVVLAFGVSVAVGVLAGAMPAARAARLDPVEALRRH